MPTTFPLKVDLPEKIGSIPNPDDFVELVRLIEMIGVYHDDEKKTPLTRDEIAAWLEQFLQVDHAYPDYKTLEVCSNGSDLIERMLAALERMTPGNDPAKEE
ncbi:hypothetical protein [Filimonas effusa]|uniref:Uncharacterized protein n=1 Tax=Filimonas effusa TaxID=2508721 RepID=A0A4Q1DBZ4_9BACT|nr:hypothetical protein [Filimonas effusa]RXK87014.1 hypothetical protein ESB13_09590 [Filimonas effusa]